MPTLAYSKYKKIFEEENTQQQQNNNTDSTPTVDNSAAIATARQKIVELQSQLQRKTEQYNTEKANIEKQIVLYNNQLVKLGSDPQQTQQQESVNYKFSKKLYESLQTSKADELSAAVKSTFDNLDNLSYYMDDKGCTTFARRILAWLNEQNWNDGVDHWEEVEDKLRLLLSGGNISMSRREINDFCAEFKKVLSTNTVFGWIFGNKLVRR